jgi:hypothetical protein
LQGRTEQNEVTEQTAGRNRQQYQPARLAKNRSGGSLPLIARIAPRPILAIKSDKTPPSAAPSLQEPASLQSATPPTHRGGERQNNANAGLLLHARFPCRKFSGRRM